LPLSVFEAMACGAVVLGTPTPLLLSLIKNGENGFIMDDNSPEVIANNILKCLTGMNLENIAKEAYESVIKEFSFAATCKKWEKNLVVIHRSLEKGKNGK